MKIFQRLLVKKRPVIKRDDIQNFDKVAKFVVWFIKKEPMVKVVNNRSSNIIFDEGYRPKAGNQNNPESVKPNIKSLLEWFILKIYLDLNILKDSTKDEFMQFIDVLDKNGNETLIISGEIASKYGLIFENFIYEREIEKIPSGREREWFKENFLCDNVIGAEIRILAWLYHEYFNDWYQVKEDRTKMPE